MAKYTKVRKWAVENGYEVEDIVTAYTEKEQLRVIIDEEHSFLCETRDSTVYMSVKGRAGNAGGLYLTDEYKPKDGRLVRNYSFWKSSQRDIIDSIKDSIYLINKKKGM